MIAQKMRASLALVLLACLPCACRDTQSPVAAVERIVLEAPCGFRVAVWLHRPAQANPPGLLLLHAYGGTHERWRSFAERACGEGYLVALPDLPGHGESRLRRGETVPHQSFRPEDWRAMAADFSVVGRAMCEAGANPANLALVGEDMGTTLALLALQHDPQWQAAVLLSPGLEYQGVPAEPAIRELVTRPVLLMASENDAYSASSAETLKNAAPGFSQLEMYSGTAHGADLFVMAPTAEDTALHWLGETIGLQKR